MDVANATLNVTLNETAANATSTVNDPQGLIIAYFSLFIMAIIPIYIGSEKSLQRLLHQKSTGEENTETMTSSDAAKFPLYASAALFGLYVFFRVFSKEYINMLLNIYFFILGVIALASTINSMFGKYIPDLFVNKSYTFLLTENEATETKKEANETTKETKKEVGDKSETSNKSIMDFTYTRKDLIGLGIAVIVGLWYLIKKHWIANNLFGLAFSINALEYMHLNKVITGCILLGGLFIYDIFWVFGTNVMVTVAKSFDAPIKLIIPRDLVVTGLSSKNFAMLGLGDIVIPGIFVALLLRFDYSQNKGRRTYFFAGYIAYIIGLATTMVVMHVFKHAQPALLYLVPACLGIPICLSLILGDYASLFKYEDQPEKDKKN